MSTPCTGTGPRSYEVPHALQGDRSESMTLEQALRALLRGLLRAQGGDQNPPWPLGLRVAVSRKYDEVIEARQEYVGIGAGCSAG